MTLSRSASFLGGFLLAASSTLAAWSASSAQAATGAPPSSSLPARPKLILLLVIDQFRADYLLRFESRFLPPISSGGKVGGFRYLMSKGAYFPMAEYSILQSMTCPGHATVLTGALPYQMGIPLNTWQDTASNRFVYCAEDATHPTVGAPMVEHVGTSPRNLNGTTVGDELKNAGLPSRVVTVALKDRSAIMMGGQRADLALWMDGKTQRWVSSTYYLPDGKLPAWVEKLNSELKAREGETVRWEAQGKGTGFSDESLHPADDKIHIGNTFPHVLKAGTKPALSLPYGLELTEAAAERALAAYQLGRGPSTDLMAVSFSSHDYVGHAFGPNSREQEEMTIAEDRLISKFLNQVRASVPGGLSNVVIALTGDHGIPPTPGYSRTHRLNADMINEKELTAALEKRLSDRFGKPEDGQSWISYNHDLNIYVNRKTVADRGANLRQVLDEIKAHASGLRSVAHAFTSYDVAERRLPPGQHERQTLSTFVPGRSGDVVMIPRPFHMIDDGDMVTHLTGYNYDRMVPLIIAGQRMRAGNYPQHVRVIDLAPTLSYLANVLPPALSEGRVLNEAIADVPGASPSKSRAASSH